MIMLWSNINCLYTNTADLTGIYHVYEVLYQCMNTAKFLSRFDPNRAPTGKFLDVIHKLSSRPRSLRQISRVAIYKSLNRQLNLGVPHLPLPTSVKRYLVNVE